MKHSDIYKRIYPKSNLSSSSPKESNTRQKADVLKSKLGKYAAVSTAFITIAPNLEAEVIYTNVDPDVVVNAPTATGTNFYTIDFDGDGNDDVAFSAINLGGSSVVGAYGFGNNRLMGSSTTFGQNTAGTLLNGDIFKTILPYALAQGASVGPSGNFPTAPGTYLGTYINMNSNNTNGNWITPNTNAYVGVQFDISGQTRYGWVRLIVNNSGQFTVLGYAYENTGAVIKTGKGGGVPTLSEWGLITLAIFLLSFGTLYIGRREEILAAQSSSGAQFKIGHFWQKPPFKWEVFWKTLLATAGLAAVAGGLSLFAYGTIAAADIIGTAIAGPLFAYLMHLLWIFERDNKN